MKIDRLLSILLLLMKKERVTAPELAEYFETSLRTIYRDMESLSQAGIPLYGEQGSGGGYSLMPGFTLDRQVLKVDELMALLAGLKGLQEISDDPAVRQTYEKVRAVAPEERDTLEIDFFSWDRDREIRDRVRLLRKAIMEYRVTGFYYTNLQGERIFRETEPHKLFFQGSHWYLLAWCRLKEDFRFFRITRMESPEILKKSFTTREFGESDWKAVDVDRQVREPVRLKVSPEGAVKAKEFFSRDHYEEMEDRSLQIEVPFPPDEWLYSYLLGYGASIEVLHPPELRQELVRRARAFVENNKT